MRVPTRVTQAVSIIEGWTDWESKFCSDKRIFDGSSDHEKALGSDDTTRSCGGRLVRFFPWVALR